MNNKKKKSVVYERFNLITEYGQAQTLPQVGYKIVGFIWESGYLLSFPILGLHDSTRALQSSPLQNSGG